MDKIEYPIATDTSRTPLPFSPATKVGNLLFVSGQASTDDDGKLIPDTFDNEFHRTMDRLQRILTAAGTGLQHVCQVRGYLKNSSDFPRYNELYRQYFKPPYPARTTISECLGKVLVEIDCIAVVEASK
jgi:2-iminobutanoate/2-iminopropanoate deaminase